MSLNLGMKGVIVAGTTNGMTMVELVDKIVANPSSYYFNFHSAASFSYWKRVGKSALGFARGPMKLVAPCDQPTSENSHWWCWLLNNQVPPPAEVAKPKMQCTAMYSNAETNEVLKAGPKNADAGAIASVTCMMCSDSVSTASASCTTTVFAATTPLIAAHIHEVPTSSTNADGNGPPVVNFCGSNYLGAGGIDDGTLYTQECAATNAQSVSLSLNQTGVIVAGTTNGMTLVELVDKIVADPSKYYFNIHSAATFAYWKSAGKGPLGMARGPMMLSKAPCPVGRSGAFCSLLHGAQPPTYSK
jgi:hypothetical protein